MYVLHEIHIKTTLKETCESRNDEWAAEVLGGCHILSSMQHTFLDKKTNQMPKSKKTDDSRISGTPGRPKKSKIEQAFLHTFYERPEIRGSRRTEEIHHSHCSKADKSWHQINFFYFQVGIPSVRFISSLQQNIDFIPEALQIFLTEFFWQADSSLKVVSIGQVSTQACRSCF